MAEFKLKTVTRTQGNNHALKDGTVKPKTFAFDFVEIPVLIDGFRRQPARRLPLVDANEPVPSAEEQVLLGVEHGDLAGALNSLSPELRAVVQATVLDGLTTREAGRLLGIPPGTVKTRMMRAKPLLREALV